jgi:NAD-dependent DNA ligase
MFTPIPAGWSEDTLNELFEAIPKAFLWIEGTFGKQEVKVKEEKKEVIVSNVTKQYVCFTGVRDKVLEAEMVKRGWEMEDSVTKKTNLLVVADGDGNLSSGKAKKAQQLGIRILALTEAKKEILGSS